MFKHSNTIGHGTIKKLRTGAVISTLALSFMGGVVSADEVVTSSEATGVVSPSENSEVKEEVPTTSVGSSVVAEELPTYEVTGEVLAEAGSAVVNQEGLVAEASALVSATTDELVSTTNELTSIDEGIASAGSVTSAMLDEATVGAEKAGMAYEEVSSLVAPARAEVEKLSSEVAKQEGIVSEARTTLGQAEASLAEARATVAELEKGTDITSLEGNVSSLEGRVTVAEGVVVSAQKAYDLEVTLSKDKEKAVAGAKAEVAKADSLVSGTANALSTAQATEAQALDVLNTTKEELKTVPHYSEVPKLTIPKEFVNLLKRYFDEGKPESISNQLADMGLDVLGSNAFVGFEKLPNDDFTYDLYATRDKYLAEATEYERNHKVDINNLSREDRIHLTAFSTELINQIRDAFGSEHVIANLDAIDIADVIARMSAEKRGHDDRAIYNAGEPYGLVHKPDAVFTNGLSLIHESVGYYLDSITSLADVKEFVKQKVLTMLTWDKHANWLHTFTITNYRTKDLDSQEKYLGTGYRSFGDYTGVYHMETISTQALERAEKNGYTKKFNTENNVYYANANSLYEKAKARVVAAQSAYDTAKAGVAKTQQDYTNAKIAQTEAREVLSGLNNRVVDVDGALAKLNDAKANLATTQGQLAKAREVLTLAKTGEAGRLKALKQARDVEARATNARTLAEGAYVRASGVLTTLRERLAGTQATLDGILARVEEAKAAKMGAEVEVVRLTKALTDKEATLKELAVRKEATLKRLAELKARLETEELAVSERKAVLDTLITEYEGYKALAKAQVGTKADENTDVEGGTNSSDVVVVTTDKGNETVETETTIEEVATVDEGTTMVDEVVTTETKTITDETDETSSQDIVVPIHLVDKEKTTSKQVQPSNAEESSKSVTNTPTYSRVAKQLPKTNSSNSVTLTLLGTLLLALGITAYRRKEN